MKNSIQHLVKVHGFYENGEPVPVIQDNESTPIHPRILQQSLTNSIPRLIFNSDVFKHLLLRWIITNNISFHQAVSPVLRILFMYLCTVVSIVLFLFE